MATDLFDYYQPSMEDSSKLDVFVTIRDIIPEEWKSDITKYTTYMVKDSDDLMKIAYDFYRTKEDWWVIYLFNDMNSVLYSVPDCNECLIMNVETKMSNIENYTTISGKEQAEVKDLVIEFYRVEKNYTLKNAIITTNNFLTDTTQSSSTLSEIEMFLFDKFNTLNEEKRYIKIPKLETSRRIKTLMDQRVKTWKNS